MKEQAALRSPFLWKDIILPPVVYNDNNMNLNNFLETCRNMQLAS